MKPQRIAVIGNLANVGYLVAKALRDEGLDADLYVTSKDGAMPPGQDPHIRFGLPRQDWIRVFATRPVIGQIRAGRRLFRDYDLVFAITLSPAYAQFFGPPMIAVATGSDMREFAFERGAYPFLLRRAYRKARHVHYVVAGLQGAAARLGLADKSSLLPLMVDMDRYAPEDRARSGELRLFWPSAWFAIKGTGRFVDACRILFAEGVPFHVTVVNHAEDDALAPEDRERVLGLIRDFPERFTVLEPIRDQDELRDRYLDADLTVDQFILGDVGLIDTESMALERPVLDYFDPAFAAAYGGEAPPVINAGTADEITDALRGLATDPDMRRRLMAQGKEARAWVGKHHGTKAVARKLLRTIDAA